MGDLDGTRFGELTRKVTSVVHQFSPVGAADGTRGVGRACAAVSSAMLGECTDRRFQALANRTAIEGSARRSSRRSVALGDAAQFGMPVLSHALSVHQPTSDL
ncbi:hypothetical protein A4X20_05940 [Mycolicibacterium iranicum]|uniref:Uncharacterized protein n=1 Tax=Mycolicibacterium iranicum TaxID=912594 RepID=A0A178LTH5_MYCIR|nr:hypothetical protein A4X20_05940 [Mycolicibacterium iranicum]